MSEVLVVADGAPDLGLGHLVRSSAVAAALVSRGLDVVCRANKGSQPQWVDGVRWEPFGEGHEEATTLVLDSYLLDPEETKQAVGAKHLVLMHDHTGDVPAADLVIAPASTEERTDSKLTGLRFACLRPAFWGLRPREVRERVERVLVATGGTDPGGHGVELATIVRDTLPGARVGLLRAPHVVGGLPDSVEDVKANPLLDELLAADIVVCGAGQTMLEAVAAGTPCVALPLAENQREQGGRLAEARIVRLLEPEDHEGLAATLTELASSAEARGAMSARGQKLIDGNGALRVAFSIGALVRGGA